MPAPKDCGTYPEVGPVATTAIDLVTINAYLETHYSVMAPEPFKLEVGQVSPALLDLFARHGVSSAAYITAFNPFSNPLTGEENLARQQALEAVIQGRGLVYFKGEGRHPAGNWPAEASLLILGLSLDDSRTLGRRFGQNAVVWAGADACPRLLLLR